MEVFQFAGAMEGARASPSSVAGLLRPSSVAGTAEDGEDRPHAAVGVPPDAFGKCSERDVPNGDRDGRAPRTMFSASNVQPRWVMEMSFNGLTRRNFSWTSVAGGPVQRGPAMQDEVGIRLSVVQKRPPKLMDSEESGA